MTEKARTWTRVALVYLAASFGLVGVWAAAGPQSFYDDFPGAGRQWLAGDGPYNAHLAGDTGAGFLAVAVVLALAALWMERRVVQAALAAAAVHGIVHLLVHLRYPNDALDSVDAAASNGSLLFGTVLAAVLLVAVNRSRVPATQP